MLRSRIWLQVDPESAGRVEVAPLCRLGTGPENDRHRRRGNSGSEARDLATHRVKTMDKLNGVLGRWRSLPSHTLAVCLTDERVEVRRRFRRPRLRGSVSAALRIFPSDAELLSDTMKPGFVRGIGGVNESWLPLKAHISYNQIDSVFARRYAPGVGL